MAVDIFENHDGVVDQPGERERQAAKHHAVHGRPVKLQNNERRQHGKRNGEEDGHRGAHAAEEDQNHQAGEKESDAPFVKQGLDGGAAQNGIDRKPPLSASPRAHRQMLQGFRACPSTTVMVFELPPCLSTGR